MKIWPKLAYEDVQRAFLVPLVQCTDWAAWRLHTVFGGHDGGLTYCMLQVDPGTSESGGCLATSVWRELFISMSLLNEEHLIIMRPLFNICEVWYFSGSGCLTMRSKLMEMPGTFGAASQSRHTKVAKCYGQSLDQGLGGLTSPGLVTSLLILPKSPEPAGHLSYLWGKRAQL